MHIYRPDLPYKLFCIWLIGWRLLSQESEHPRAGCRGVTGYLATISTGWGGQGDWRRKRYRYFVGVLVLNNQPTPQRNSSKIINNYLTRNLFSRAVSWYLMFSARKCQRNIPLKFLGCLSFYLHQKFCFGKDCLCSIVLVRGSFQDNVAVFVHFSRLSRGSPGKGAVCTPSAHQCRHRVRYTRYHYLKIAEQMTEDFIRERQTRKIAKQM